MDMVLIGNIRGLISKSDRLAIGPSLIPCRCVERSDGLLDLLSIDDEQNQLVSGASRGFLDALCTKGLLRARSEGDNLMFGD